MRPYHSRLFIVFSTAFLCLLLALVSACSSPFASSSPGSQGKTNRGDGVPTPSQAASATSQPLQVQTSCPAAGTARAAVMPFMTLGNHQTVVYAWSPTNSSTGGILRRYDTTTRNKTDIVTLPNAQIFWTQISQDGQWIFFESHVAADHDAIQLVRMDGQYLQTLYCQADTQGSMKLSTVSLSPDQKTIALSLAGGSSADSSLVTLDLTSGAVQTVVNGTLLIETWLDSTHLIVETNSAPFDPSNPPTIYLVDVTQHHQQLQHVQVLRKEQTNCYGVGNSLNSNVVYVWEWTCSPGGWQGPSVIRSVPVSGTLPNGWPALIMTDNGRAINPVTPLNLHTVFYVTNDGTTSAAPGFWKVSTDGNGNATQLFAAGPGQNILTNAFSRDGTLYAVEIRGTTTEAISIGSVNGGNPSVIAHDNAAGTLTVTGWTTF